MSMDGGAFVGQVIRESEQNPVAPIAVSADCAEMESILPVCFDKWPRELSVYRESVPRNPIGSDRLVSHMQIICTCDASVRHGGAARSGSGGVHGATRSH